MRNSHFRCLSSLAFSSFALVALSLSAHSDIDDVLLDADSDEVMVMAHRGDWRNHPENSLSGMQSCIDNRVEIVEIDVRKTSDGVLILMHDTTVDRTTDGSGSVSNMTLAEIKALRLKLADGTVTDEEVPTLQEAMLLAEDLCMVYLDKVFPSLLADSYAVLQQTDTVDHAIFRATGSAQSVLDTFLGQGVDRSAVYIALKIVCSGTGSPTVQQIMSEVALVDAEVLQINYNDDQHPVFDPANVSAIRQRGTRPFVNVLPDRIHPDPQPGQDPVDWDWVLDRGINVLQTDRPLWLTPYVDGYAYYEQPAHGSTNVSDTTDLSWMQARGAVLHDIYLGTSFEAVRDAMFGSPEYLGGQVETTYSPASLDPSSQYHWRVDEVIPGEVWKSGEVWSFTTVFQVEGDAVPVFADSYTHNADSSNFGGDVALRAKFDSNSVDHMRFTYLQFDLSGYQGRTIDAAALELTTTSSNEPVAGDSTTGTHTYRLWGLDPAAAGNDWGELTLTGSNRPAAYSFNDGTDSGTYEYVDEAQTWGGTALLTWNHQPPSTTLQIGGDDASLLAFLDAAKEQSSGMVTLILGKDGHAANSWGSFRSKEGSSVDRPALIIDAGPGLAYCFGDPGSGFPCPCSNDNDGSVPGSGCDNGVFASGAKLAASGSPSVSNDTLILSTSGLEPNNSGLYFQANNAVNGGAGNVFGDGLRCAGGGLVRLQVRTADSLGNSSTSVSIAAKGGASAGDVRRYQCWYRTTTNPPCGIGVNDFNLSNGYEIVWLP